jgi:hypothetical protein
VQIEEIPAIGKRGGIGEAIRGEECSAVREGQRVESGDAGCAQKAKKQQW